MLAARHVGWPRGAFVVFAALAVAAGVPAFQFMRTRGRGAARAVERVSQAWPALTYLSLGILPLLPQLLHRVDAR
jgi:hypothetical protein